MWKLNKQDNTTRSTINGWTLIIDNEKSGSNQNWWRIARRSSLVQCGNANTIEEAKIHLTQWANSHNYAGKGKIEKV